MLRRKYIFIVCVVLGVLIFIANSTSPYSNPTLIDSPFSTSVTNKREITLQQTHEVSFTKNIFIDTFAKGNKNLRFIVFILFPERPVKGNEAEIIKTIHKQSFDPQKPYIISGSHFADMYARNPGIFYNAVLDNRIALDKEDWTNRQRSYLESIALHLELLKQSKQEYTTFIPVAGSVYTAENVYTQPSDSLFGLLFALSALQNEHFIHELYPSPHRPLYPLQTQHAAMQLVKNHKTDLSRVVNNYYEYVIDSQTGLVKKDITLSSARDGIKRESSFYDNVIVWATLKYAKDLGILDKQINFDAWKTKIETAFWSETEGLFIDDLSKESQQKKLFSADAFIVLGSGFFNMHNTEDKRKLIKLIVYVNTHHLNEPFPLHYASSDQPDRLYGPVKAFAPSYMGKTIWSHWGIEYIKALILLSPQDPHYKKEAEKYLEMYKKNIEKYGGYPELYDANGTIYQTPFYKSVLLTSWVVNYEQAKMLLE